MKWAPAKNAPPASAEHLRNNLANEEAAANALAAEQAEIEAAQPALVGEPNRYVEAQVRLREIEALLPSKRRTVDAIRQAIPAAEKREEKERLRAQIAEQQRKSAKLRRDLKARYAKAVGPFVEVLRDIKADEDAWRFLKVVAQGLREPVDGNGAEWSLRLEAGAANGGSWWQGTVTDDLTVRDWDGRILFK